MSLPDNHKRVSVGTGDGTEPGMAGMTLHAAKTVRHCAALVFSVVFSLR